MKKNNPRKNDGFEVSFHKIYLPLVWFKKREPQKHRNQTDNNDEPLVTDIKAMRELQRAIKLLETHNFCSVFYCKESIDG